MVEPTMTQSDDDHRAWRLDGHRWRHVGIAVVLVSIGVVMAMATIYELRGFGPLFAMTAGGGTLLLAASAMLTYRRSQSSRLVLDADGLVYHSHFLGFARRRTIRFDELDAFYNFEAHLLSSTATTGFVDETGEVWHLPGSKFSNERDYREFRRALEEYLEATGHSEHIRDDSEAEEKRRKAHDSTWFLPATYGFGALLVAVFTSQNMAFVFEYSEFPSLLSEIPDRMLLDSGALWAGSGFDTRWDRIVTSGLLHSEIVDFIMLIAMLGMASLYVEPYLGAVQTTIVLLVGCLAGPAFLLVAGTEEVIVGAWGAVYGIVGAAALLIRRRKLQLIHAHRHVGVVAGVWLFYLPVIAPLNVMPVSPLAGLGMAFAGLVAGVATTWLLLVSSSSPLGDRSPLRSAIAVGLVLLFVAGAATSAFHYLRGDDHQSARIQWVESKAQQTETYAEKSDVVQSVHMDIRMLPDAEERRLMEALVHSIDMPPAHLASAFGTDTPNSRFRCTREEPDELDFYNEMVVDMLPADQREAYLEQLHCICVEDGSCPIGALVE